MNILPYKNLGHFFELMNQDEMVFLTLLKTDAKSIEQSVQLITHLHFLQFSIDNIQFE
jgi:hypothetical protein